MHSRQECTRVKLGVRAVLEEVHASMRSSKENRFRTPSHPCLSLLGLPAYSSCVRYMLMTRFLYRVSLLPARISNTPTILWTLTKLILCEVSPKPPKPQRCAQSSNGPTTCSTSSQPPSEPCPPSTSSAPSSPQSAESRIIIQ